MYRRRLGTILLTACAVCLVLGGCSDERYLEVVEVVPAVDFDLVAADGDPDYDAILDTYRKVGDLHTMTFHGDFDKVLEGQHRQILILMQAYPEGLPRKRGCSMFRYGNGPGGLVGRNFDNRFSELLVGYHYPAEGYPSISFVPLMELGYSRENPFDPGDISNRRSLLTGPVLAIEGMNEKGVTVALASLDRRKVRQDPDRKPRFLIHVVRDILDHAGNLNEAIAIAEGFNVFDNGREIISHHIFVADPTGSVVLEWRDGEMEVVREEKNRQVVTNSDMYLVPEGNRRQSCPRYRKLARSLNRQEGAMDWRQEMDALAGTIQRNRHYNIDGENLRVSTQWSTIFDLEQLKAYVCLNSDYRKVYRLGFPSPGPE